MPAIIVGKPSSGQKVLRKSVITTEIDGLTLLTETYTIRTSDIASIEPDRNTLHSAFVDSSQTPKYSRMSVETTRIEPLDGDLSSLVVNYVGMTTASGLPPAYVTAVGQPGAGVFGADASIVAKYITTDSYFNLLKGGVLTLDFTNSQIIIPTKRLMPASINGTIMPPNPRQREYRRNKTRGEIQAAQAASIAEANARAGRYGNYTVGSLVPYPVTIEWIYAGYVQTSISFTRRGLFNQIEEQFTEYFRGTDAFYTGDGIPNVKKIEAYSDQNFIF
jgi:hypothetical protein